MRNLNAIVFDLKQHFDRETVNVPRSIGSNHEASKFN